MCFCFSDVDYFYENQYYKIRYTGQIRDGAPNGKGSGRGQLTYFNEKSQFTYEGVWRNGLPNKDGEITYAAHGFYKQRPWKNGYWVV